MFGWIADGGPAASSAFTTSPPHLLLQSKRLPSMAAERTVPFKLRTNIRPLLSENTQVADHVRPPEPVPPVATTFRAPPGQSEKLAAQPLTTDQVNGRAIPEASQSRILADT